MSFRERLEAEPETVQEIEAAAELRYEEAILFLKNEATRTIGVYVMGYAAEMLLKTAYFRFRDAASYDNVGDLLGAAKLSAKALEVVAVSENYHSLLFWTQLLLRTRSQDKRKLPKYLETELHLRTERLYQNWWVEMRYHALTATEQEALLIRKDVEWLRKHYESLWR